MSNKTKKVNKVNTTTEVVEDEIETGEVVEVTVENNETETTQDVEVKTGSNDSETEVEVKTKKVFKPIAKMKDLNWKKVAADTLKVGVGLAIGYKIAKNTIGKEEKSYTTDDVVDAEFTELENDVDNVTTEEEM